MLTAALFGDRKGCLGHLLKKIHHYLSFFLLPFITDLSTGQLGNTTLVWHNGKLFALMEGEFPHLFRVCSGAVRSIRAYTFGGALEHEFSAHPKIDPNSGGMVGVAYGYASNSTRCKIRVRLVSCSFFACLLFHYKSDVCVYTHVILAWLCIPGMQSKAGVFKSRYITS